MGEVLSLKTAKFKLS